MTETAHTLPRSGGEAREFRRGILPTVVRGLIASAFASAAALFLIPQFVPPMTSIADRGKLLVVAVVVLLVVVWGTLFWLRNVRVVVSPDAVEIGRPGKRETYARDAAVFRSKITEHRTNGMRTSTTRALVVHTAGREIEIELPGFTRAAFNELMALLVPLAPEQPADPVAAARLRSQVRRDFEVDASRERRLGTVFLVVCLVFLIASIGVAVSVLSAGELDGDSIAILITPVTALLALGFGIGAFQRFRTARRAPRQVTVGHLGIRLDDGEHAYAQLTRIWVTPPSYGGAKRMRLEQGAGRTITVILSGPRIVLTPEYAELVASLRSETAGFPGLLSLDLE